MGLVIVLPIEWKITKIPRFKTEDDAEALRRRCDQLFRIKGNRKMVVILKRGEIVDGFADVDQVIAVYRLQGALSMITFTEAPITVLTQIHF